MKVRVVDDLPPESIAMLQALYSRSPASVDTHLERVLEVGADRFMSTYYVGYNHKSIGDCGTTTIFLENVSMLAAKAIQNWPLYRGQEASTRYMDFSSAVITDPVGTEQSREILDSWMKCYHNFQEPVREHLVQQYPRREGEDETKYNRAIDARKFDILRAFLPAGTTTNVSWHCDIRQAGDHLMWLVRHPDHVIRAAAVEIRNLLIEKYPSSFAPPSSDDDDVGTWVNQMAQRYTYNTDEYFSDDPYRPYSLSKYPVVTANFGMPDIGRRYLTLLKTRPKKAELPHFLSQYGQIQASYLLDFGSFRDLQRHRNGVVRMPRLTTRWGFHTWYLDQLPEHLRRGAVGFIATQVGRISRLPATDLQRQYYIPMGFLVPCLITQCLPAYVYRLELRTGQTVHPTLRAAVQGEVNQFRRIFPDVALHVDMSPDTWSLRRGGQTITPR